MGFNTSAFPRAHSTRPLRIIRTSNRITFWFNRIEDWVLTAGLFILCVFSACLCIYMEAGQTDTTTLIIFVALLVVAPTGSVISFVLARNWRLALDLHSQDCVYTKTYLGRPYFTLRVSMRDGFLGPYTMWSSPKRPPKGTEALGAFGPIGMVAGLVLANSGRGKTKAIDYPGIIHYDPASDETTLMLLLKNERVRDEVLKAMRDFAPNWINVS